jgi:hypothetical protein
MRIINTYTFVFILAFMFISQSSFASPIPPQFFVENFGVFSVEEEMILEWTISKDIDIDYFVIEKSNDNSDTFNEIGRIQVKNTGEDALFIFSDENLEKYNNYRIRVHLKNGVKQTSQVLRGTVKDQDIEEIPSDFKF